ncbi:efflux RND transporter periplasmic adaptor subunit [bacterium]|nr:efflux RND transporter periplasmic adaptor subunit [bacterium]
MSRKKMWILWVILSAMMFFNRCSDSGDTENIVSVPVEVQPVQYGNVIQSRDFQGDIRAEFEVKVFSKIPDRIETFYVDEGDRVREGEPIAKIVATTIEQAVLQAEAGLAAAKAQEANLRTEYDRAQRLREEDAISQQQFDGIRTQYEAVAAQVQQAEAGLASVRSQLKDATVSAPISGIIGERYYEAGDMASPAMPVVSIVQMDNVKIVMNATEEDLGRLEVGQDAEVTVRSYPNQIFKGKVQKISPILDPITRMATIEVLVPNPHYQLKPGMYAEVKVITGIIENTVVIPRYAVIENTSLENQNGEDKVIYNYFVYVVNDSGYAEQRKLEVDYINHIQLSVLSGVNVNENLVVIGQNNLRDGVPVLITNDEEGE